MKTQEQWDAHMRGVRAQRFSEQAAARAAALQQVDLSKVRLEIECPHCGVDGLARMTEKPYEVAGEHRKHVGASCRSCGKHVRWVKQAELPALMVEGEAA